MDAEGEGLAQDAERALAEHVRAERLRFVFIQSALPIIFSPLAAAILSLTLWQAADRPLLVGWTIGLVVIAAGRVMLVGRFARAPQDSVDVRRWERIFVTSIVVVDVWWGIGAVALLPTGLTERAVVFTFVMLMAGGHTASYSAHPATVVIGVLALTLPITVAFAFKADGFHLALAFVAVMYVAASFRSIKTLSFFFNRSYRLSSELQQEKERAEQLARIDFLTALLNRRAFYEAAETALEVAKRYGRSVCLVMLDIDHFKSINDRFGHAAGDAVIQSVAARIRIEVRAGDVVGRLGGEEFAVLLPETTMDDAATIAERIRANVQMLVVSQDAQAIRFTISAGVAAVRADDTLATVLAASDAALYDAKRSGRNRVICAGAHDPQFERDRTRAAITC